MIDEGIEPKAIPLGGTDFVLDGEDDLFAIWGHNGRSHEFVVRARFRIDQAQRIETATDFDARDVLAAIFERDEVNPFAVLRPSGTAELHAHGVAENKPCGTSLEIVEA